MKEERPSAGPTPWSAPREAIAPTIAAGLGGALGALAIAVLAGHFLDAVLRGEAFRFDLFLGLAAVILGKAGLAWIARMGFHQVGAKTKPLVRSLVERQVIRLGPAGRADQRTGSVAHDAVEGVEALDPYYGLFLPQLIVGLAAPPLLCAGIAWMDPLTGLTLLATTPLAPLLLGLTRHRFRSVSTRYHAAAAAMSADFLDAVQGLPTLKMFNRGKAHGENLRARSEKLRRETMRLLAINQTAILLLDWGFSLGATTVGFALAVWRFRLGALTAGEGVAVVLITVEIVRQFNLLGAFFFAGAGGRAMVRRLREFLSRSPVVKDPFPASQDGLPTSPPEIRFENVSFAYQPDEPVLRNVSFRVNPGEHVALVGPSGVGKSTAVQLLLRFYDPDQGRIFLGGQSIDELPLIALRRRIAVVSQDTWLFHGTIADNLRVARPTATAAEMTRALAAANLEEWVRALPDGLETPLGERAERMSGGQAQRLAVARAFLKNAPLLILDEPTAHLDAAAEHCLLAALDRLARGRTVLHITHRASAARRADRVVRLDASPLSFAQELIA